MSFSFSHQYPREDCILVSILSPRARDSLDQRYPIFHCGRTVSCRIREQSMCPYTGHKFLISQSPQDNCILASPWSPCAKDPPLQRYLLPSTVVKWSSAKPGSKTYVLARDTNSLPVDTSEYLRSHQYAPLITHQRSPSSEIPYLPPR